MDPVCAGPATHDKGPRRSTLHSTRVPMVARSIGLTFSVSELTQSGISVSDPCCNEGEMNESEASLCETCARRGVQHGV